MIASYIYMQEHKVRNGHENGTESLEVRMAEEYLKLPNLFEMNLDQLELVDICGVVGSNADLLLVKCLFASSPSLRWINVSLKVEHPKEEFMFVRQLARLPRASTKVEIKYICP